MSRQEEYAKLPNSVEETKALYQEMSGDENACLAASNFWLIEYRKSDQEYKKQKRLGVVRKLKENDKMSVARAQLEIDAELVELRQERLECEAVYKWYWGAYQFAKTRRFNEL